MCQYYFALSINNYVTYHSPAAVSFAYLPTIFVIVRFRTPSPLDVEPGHILQSTLSSCKLESVVGHRTPSPRCDQTLSTVWLWPKEYWATKTIYLLLVRGLIKCVLKMLLTNKIYNFSHFKLHFMNNTNAFYFSIVYVFVNETYVHSRSKNLKITRIHNIHTHN